MDNQAADEEAIFLAALDKATLQERLAYVKASCSQDSALCQRVIELLALHDESDGPPDSLPPSNSHTVDLTHVAERPGTVIDRYRLLQEIGAGGMGVVYLAEQCEPVRRNVALKVIKPGLDSRQFIARFEVERQALALMDHPHIAHVLDAGATASGRPYFVMELVKGMRITDYCDQNELTIRERLELFVTVCQAVQHAHQKGIIHRDIKPSNVLVEANEDSSFPKIIDFGVAKAFGRTLTDKTGFTGHGYAVGTPMYMSPEQADMRRQDVDTRSDIYSLGALLYELLTGATPFDRQRIHDAGYEEVRSILCSEEPTKPSDKIRTLGEDATPVSRHRRVDATSLKRQLQGDLDWIVMKALEKDRTRRYETASGFAKDVLRYLNDEPVEAGPPSKTYRLRKFARRNRTALVTAAIVTSALFAGAGIATWQAVRATRANTVSELQRARAEANFQAALKAVDEVLSHVASEELANVPQMQRVREELLQDALRFYLQFVEDNRNTPELQRETALAFHRLGTVQTMLGKSDQAEESLHQAINLLENLAMDDTDEPFPYLKTLIGVHASLGNLFYTNGRWSEAEEAFATSLRYSNQVIAAPMNAKACEHLVAESLTHLAMVQARTGRHAEAEKSYRSAIEIQLRLDDGKPSYKHRFDLALSYHNLGNLMLAAGQMPAAEEAYKAALELRKELASQNPTSAQDAQRLAYTLSNLGVLHKSAGRLKEAENLYRSVIAIQERLASSYPAVPEYRSDLADAYGNRAVVVRALGRSDAAAEDYSHAIAVLERLVIEFPDVEAFRSSLATFHFNFGNLLSANDRFEEAMGRLRKAIEEQRELMLTSPEIPDHRLNLARSLNSLAYVFDNQGQLQDAAAARDEAREIQLGLVVDFPNTPQYAKELARSFQFLRDRLVALKRAGRKQEAENGYVSAIPKLRELAEDFPNDASWWTLLCDMHRNLGILLLESGRGEAALANYQPAVDAARNLVALFPDDSRHNDTLLICLLGQGEIASAANDYPAASRAYRQAVKSAPNDARAHNAWAWLLATCPDLQIRDSERAVELASRAVELTPSDADTWNTLGVSRYRGGNWEGAIEALNKSIELGNGGGPVDWLFLAMAHIQLGDRGEACTWYDQAVEWIAKTQPNDQEITRFAAEAAELLGIRDTPQTANESTPSKKTPTTTRMGKQSRIGRDQRHIQATDLTLFCRSHQIDQNGRQATTQARAVGLCRWHGKRPQAMTYTH